MRFGENAIGLSVLEAELLMSMPFDAHRAFGSVALLKTVCERSASTLVEIMTNFANQGIDPDRLLVRTAQLEKGDNYIQVPDIERVREQLEELFNDIVAANGFETSESNSLRDLERPVAQDAIAQLNLA